MDIKRLRAKLQGAKISKKCEDEIREKLIRADELTDMGKFEKAEELLTGIDTDFENCLKNKREIEQRAGEVDSKIKLSSDKIKALLWDGYEKAPIRDYLSSLRNSAKDIETRFDVGSYSSLDELKNKLNDIEAENDKLLAKPNGLLPILERIDQIAEDLGSLDDGKIQSAWSEGISELKKGLARVISKEVAKDLTDRAAKEETNIIKAADAVKKLKEKKEEIEKKKRENPDLDITNAEKELKNCMSKLEKRDVPTEEDIKKVSIEKVEERASAVEVKPQPAIYGLKQEPGISMDIQLEANKIEGILEDFVKKPQIGQPAPQPPEIYFLEATPHEPQKYGTDIKWTATAHDPQGGDLEYMFILKGPGTTRGGTGKGSPTGWIRDNEWVWTPCQSDIGENEITVEVRSSKDGQAQKSSYTVRFEVKDYDYLEKVQDWLVPKEAKIFGGLAYGLVILALAVFGYSQLYVNNPIFGANNLWQEFLLLFLWGFGIQSATADVAGISKNILKT
jgi:hypothetical protein